MKKKCYKFEMNALLLNALCLVLLVIVYIIFKLTYPVSFNYSDITLNTWLLVIFWMVLHELFHYIGFLLAKGVSNKNLFLGMFLEKGIFYCMCKKIINKKSILVALLFPLFFIGIFTLMIGYLIQSLPLCILSIVNISGAIGDILMTIQISLFPKDIQYFDKDDAVGYYIISKEDISNIKVPGLKLIDVKEFNERDSLSTDHKKIKISKLSWVVIIIYIIGFILSLFYNI